MDSDEMDYSDDDLDETMDLDYYHGGELKFSTWNQGEKCLRST